jgi:hypothetical protein
MSPLDWETIAWALPLGWMIFTIVIFWAIHLIEFHINSKYITIKLLGICLRKIPLSNIRRVSKQLKGKPEIWRNTLQANHRMLVLYRNNNLRPIVITPKNRYVFRNKVEEAINKPIKI